MEDTPQHEELSPEAKKLALEMKSELEKDVKILTAKIDSSLSVIQQELNSLHELKCFLNQRVEVKV
jgi:hypothetical protein